MRSFQRQSLSRKIIFSWPSVILLSVLAALIARLAFQSYLSFSAVSDAYLKIKKDREELSQKKDDLESRLSYLSSPYGLEKELRRRFNLKKPDEELAIIIDRKAPNSGNESGPAESLRQRLTAFFKSFLSF
jgi:cell division protein FtsB